MWRTSASLAPGRKSLMYHHDLLSNRTKLIPRYIIRSSWLGEFYNFTTKIDNCYSGGRYCAPSESEETLIDLGGTNII